MMYVRSYDLQHDVGLCGGRSGYGNIVIDTSSES
jgi:hypothetical protein